ncbi:MAG: FHA domain-containing protein [Mogibacterium sp.]|nr:FHA domain-containing protein [Mogibacterium sp.]
MLEWFKKEDSVAEPEAEKTSNMSDTQEEEMLAVLFNKKIKRGISKVPATIGKNPNAADVSFFHNSVDNVHCTIDCHNGQFTIMDNGSREGTKINRQKIQSGVPYSVNNGDSIILGKVEFEFVINYPVLEKRSREALQVQEAEKPEPKTYTIKARPVLPMEYDEPEVVYVSCGLEPEKKKAAYTQEIKTEQIREALKAAEERKVEEMPAAGPVYDVPAPAQERPSLQNSIPVFIPEPDDGPAELEKTVAMPIEEVKRLAEKPMSLTCIRGVGVGEEILIDHFPFKIGRSKANDYILKIDKISREHAIFTEKGGMYYVTDANSTNGVRVNGIRIDKSVEYRISEGDTIKLSDNVYRIGFPEKR